MDTGTLDQALQVANIQPETVYPEIMIGHRFVDGTNTWVVYVCAVNEWAFELPGDSKEEKVIGAARAVAHWDEATSEGKPLDAEQRSLVGWAVREMKPCELKSMFQR